jgi:MtN3 and saliva related transmembrane protein
MTEFIGLASGMICVVAMAPQVYKSYKTGSTDDISTSMLIMMYISMGLGTAYGFLIRHVAIYATDITLLVLYMMIHCIKLRESTPCKDKNGEQAVCDVETADRQIQGPE